MTENKRAVDLFVVLSRASTADAPQDRESDSSVGKGGAASAAAEVDDDDVMAGAEASLPPGTAMTANGPVPFAGNILDSPDIVWMDDCWTKEEEEEALRVVHGKGQPLSTFWRETFEREARKSWDLFYRRNGDKFFKDRHYLGKVFPELAETEGDRDLAKEIEIAQGIKGEDSGGDGASRRNETVVSNRGRLGRRTLLELGCGVGNAVFPLLEENRGLYVVAVDLSPRGIEVLKKHPMYTCGRCEASVLDATSDELPPQVLEDGGVDLVLLQFSLSAVAPKDMAAVARLVEKALKPGGKVLIRDYGRLDEAQLRFAKGRRLGENVYVRQDGTMSSFFSLEDLRHLFCGGSSPGPPRQGQGREPRQQRRRQYGDATTPRLLRDYGGDGGGARLIEEELSFVRRQYANRAQKVSRRRVWVHAKFRKPLV